MCRNFAANVCICNNGVAPAGAPCPMNGAANCAVCNTGFTSSKVKSSALARLMAAAKFAYGKNAYHMCAVNRCSSCNNGVPQIAVG